MFNQQFEGKAALMVKSLESFYAHEIFMPKMTGTENICTIHNKFNCIAPLKKLWRVAEEGEHVRSGDGGL